MSENTESVTFEICPLCSQRTASHLFRQWKSIRCCFVCAQRSAKDEEDEAAIMLDQKYHGMGWIWKHAVKVVAITIILLVVRIVVMHYLSAEGQN